MAITVDKNSLNGHGRHASDIIPAPTSGCTTNVTSTSTTTAIAKSVSVAKPIETIEICHANASGAYVAIVVDEIASLNGHSDHVGDIFPAPQGGCPSNAAAATTTTTLRSGVALATTTTTATVQTRTSPSTSAPRATSTTAPTLRIPATIAGQVTVPSTTTSISPVIRATDVSSSYVQICHATSPGAFVALYLMSNAAQAHAGHGNDIVPAPASGCSSGATSATNTTTPGSPTTFGGFPITTPPSSPTTSTVLVEPAATIDFGRGVIKVGDARAGTNAVGTPLFSSVGATSASRRSPAELGRETLEGFTPSSGALMEIIGARTVGQFVVLPGGVVDSVAVSAALNESVNRTAAEFVRIEKANPVQAPNQAQLDEINKIESTEDQMSRTFFDSELSNPVRLSDMNFPSNSTWVSVSARVEKYAPGSVIYLALTSSPIVVSEAVVDQNGNAQVSGVFPVQVLGSGAHNLRVIGKRLIEGVIADSKGEIKFSDEAMLEIQRFDMQTSATVRVIGFNTTGGDLTSLRVIPLRAPMPWWTIWFIVWTIILGLIVKLGNYAKKKRDIWVGVVLILLSVAPSQYYGWTEIAYPVMYWGAGIGLLGLCLWLLVPAIKRAKKTENGVIQTQN